jgi:conjugal transfer pilus assembly protein TraF
MIKLACIFFLLFFFLNVHAEKPLGFLWYNLESDKKEKLASRPKGLPFNQLSFTERDAVLRFYTMEALHKARHTKKVEDMRVFLSLQDYWLKESSRFKSLFQQTMLIYPEYDYAVTHPTSNLGAKITDEVRESQTVEIINRLSKSHGLLFFYRGKSPYDLKQIPIIADFCKRFHLSLMSISVDRVIAPELQSRIDKGQANRFGVHYFPALLLVNPKNKSITPVAYGLTTQDVLRERLVSVATQFQGE